MEHKKAMKFSTNVMLLLTPMAVAMFEREREVVEMVTVLGEGRLCPAISPPLFEGPRHRH